MAHRNLDFIQILLAHQSVMQLTWLELIQIDIMPMRKTVNNLFAPCRLTALDEKRNWHASRYQFQL